MVIQSFRGFKGGYRHMLQAPFAGTVLQANNSVLFINLAHWTYDHEGWDRYTDKRYRITRSKTT